MDAIALDDEFDLRVIYLYSQRPGRSWRLPEINHTHIILDGNRNQFARARQWVDDAELAVFGYYRDAFAYELMQVRAERKTPWCFWGERMGVTRLNWAGSFCRLWKLRQLHHSPAAIWGIGEFALERYRREFGSRRVYCNVPYFSDLSRFSLPTLRDYSGGERRILYSGSLIERKGVDLLARAFGKVSNQCNNLRLTFLGEGPLRIDLARELKECMGQVSFAGFKDWSELPALYHKAHVLCVPSRHDGWGLVVPEGLASGLPVIGTTKTGAALELIKPDNNGWLVEAGNVQQLAEALKAVSRCSAEQLAQRSASAIASVENHSLAAGVSRFKAAVDATLAAWN
jgi:glycosyltransferase involved in cell wall biosynthesis